MGSKELFVLHFWPHSRSGKAHLAFRSPKNKMRLCHGRNFWSGLAQRLGPWISKRRLSNWGLCFVKIIILSYTQSITKGTVVMHWNANFKANQFVSLVFNTELKPYEKKLLTNEIYNLLLCSTNDYALSFCYPHMSMTLPCIGERVEGERPVECFKWQTVGNATEQLKYWKIALSETGPPDIWRSIDIWSWA